ncbi:MAG TPA: glycoside hydrolase family 2 TIM barrel-domain containing protein [Bacteroidota bacterium]|nr:glycoside hydrolase family 2 TIM barrel-domain containing protein [Bacteroidota bacterium]
MTKRSNNLGLFDIFVFSLLAVFSSFFCLAQPRVYENGQPTLRGTDVGVHLDSPTRRKIDLAGTWSYTLDDEKWLDVKVPSSFDYEDQIVFQRKISIDDALLSNFAFKFVALGINNDAEVYINDIFVGKHTGGYTTVEFDVPDNALQLGSENVVKVVVSSHLSARATLPVRKQIWGWKNYGGILRDVYLLATPKLWIESIDVSAKVNDEFKQGTFKVGATISNRNFDRLSRDSTNTKSSPVSFSFSLEVQEKLSEVVIAQSVPVPLELEPNRDHEVQTSVVISAPRLWSPEAPELYIIRAVITATEGKQRSVIDQFARNTGFRRLELNKADIIVNGVKRALKGVVWHEDSPGHGGSLTYEQMEKDIALIKTLGANAIRFAFHPPHPYLLNLCARYGLFALTEAPVWNVAADVLADEIFQTLAENVLREMIQEFHDNPALIAWGIGSDFDSADPRSILYVNRITRFVKALDDRPVYFGSRMLENDLCTGSVDIAAVDLPYQDLKGFKQTLLDWEKKHPAKPVVVTGYGNEVDHENRNGWSDPMSQEHQARFFLQYYGVMREVGVAGSFISSFADWRGDRPILTVNSANPYLHPVGLMSYAGEKRLSFEMVKVLYNEEKTSAIPVGSHRSAFPVAHVVSGLFVIILGGYHYAYNRRFGEAVRRAFLRSYNFYADLRDMRAASVVHTLTLGALISVTLAVIVSSILHHYRGDKMFDYALTYVVVSDALKEQVIYATWNPFSGIVGFSVAFFVIFWSLALLVKLCSLFVRSKVSWFHAYSVPVWGALPIVFLSPVAMSLFKVMENPIYVAPSLILIAVFLLWATARVFSGISVIYDISPAKSYMGGIFVCGLLMGALYFYYDSVFAIGSYVKFAMNVARSLG